MKNFVPIFKKIEDKEFQKLVDETAKYILDIRIYGEYLLSLLSKEEKINKNTVVFTIVVEFLKKLDNVSSLIKNHSFNSINSTMRDMFELKVQILYLLEKIEKIEDRSLAYEYFHYYRKYNDSEEILKVLDSIEKNKPLSLKEKVYSQLNKNEVLNQSSFNLKLMKQKKYFKIHEIQKKTKYMKWYEANSNIKNLRGLCKYLELEDHYDTYYNVFSRDTHGLNILNNLGFSEQNIRSLKNPNFPDTNIITIFVEVNNQADDVFLKILKILQKKYYYNYCSWQINHSSSLTEKEYGYKSKKHILIEQWKDFFSSYK